MESRVRIQKICPESKESGYTSGQDLAQPDSGPRENPEMSFDASHPVAKGSEYVPVRLILIGCFEINRIGVRHDYM